MPLINLMKNKHLTQLQPVTKSNFTMGKTTMNTRSLSLRYGQIIVLGPKIVVESDFVNFS
jgi:hypothetical protein